MVSPKYTTRWADVPGVF
ncbi:DUF4113 domain-containing protein [Kiloniella majae]